MRVVSEPVVRPEIILWVVSGANQVGIVHLWRWGSEAIFAEIIALAKHQSQSNDNTGNTMYKLITSLLCQEPARLGPRPYLLSSWQCPWTQSLFLWLMGPQGGASMQFFLAVPHQAAWFKAQPPGTHLSPSPRSSSKRGPQFPCSRWGAAAPSWSIHMWSVTRS